MLLEYGALFSRKNVRKRRLVSSFVQFGSTKAGVKESRERIDTRCSDWLLSPKHGSTESKTALLSYSVIDQYCNLMSLECCATR